jgi:ABC-type Fe3+ transport system substrate-binding protein
MTKSFIYQPRGLVLGLAGIALGAMVLASGAKAADPLMYKGADRAKVILDGAKKEGKLVFYSSMIVNQALRPMTEAFMAKYPGIKVEYWRGSGRGIVQKVLAEIRAKSLRVDVIESSGIAGALMAAKVLVPFHTPESAPYSADYRQPKGLYVASRISYFGTAYNTKLVKKRELPKTYADLLDSKWKGKIAWRAGSESGAPLFIGNIIQLMGKAKGEGYLKKLAKNKIVNYSGSARALVDRTGQGEYSMAINIFSHHPLISQKKGAPLELAVHDPIPSILSTIVVPKGVKHPHAAMLFTDFFLSKEGQTVLAKANYFPPHPDVNPSKMLSKAIPRNNKMREKAFSPELLFATRNHSNDLFNKLFK